MNNSLYALLNEHVLTEGRKENVMKKYPNLSKDVIEKLSQSDPSGNNKYLEFMAKAVDDGSNIDFVISVINDFNNKLSMINKQNLEDYKRENESSWGQYWNKFFKSPKDINSYPSLNHVVDFMTFLDGVVTKKKEKEKLNKETDRIYEDENYLIVSPKTHNAACQWGRHSSWCVSTSNTNHFSNYTKKGTLYFFISKNDTIPTKYWADKDGNKPPYKTALLLQDDGQAQWWSKGDSNYTDGLDVNDPVLSPFLNQEMINRILKHNKFTIETRKQREIEKIRNLKSFYKKNNGDSSSIHDFLVFVKSKIFKPKELVEIIRNDNWLALYENSETGKEVRDQLGNSLVFPLIRELLSTTPDLLETLVDFHSQEFLTNYSSNLSDDQNKEITDIILKRLGRKPTSSEVGGDVKIYIDKWSMSPEAWDQYNNTSSYFFIRNKRGEIENLIKGDRFNPKDHHKLQMMMLRVKMNDDSALYALVTDKNILDQYIGMDSDDIPPDVKELIISKGKRLG